MVPAIESTAGLKGPISHGYFFILRYEADSHADQSVLIHNIVQAVEILCTLFIFSCQENSKNGGIGENTILLGYEAGSGILKCTIKRAIDNQEAIGDVARVTVEQIFPTPLT